MSRGYARAGRGTLENGAPVFSTVQGELFAALSQPAVIDRPNAPDLDIGAELLGAMHAAMREARDANLSRDRIADRMNLALPNLKRPVTRRQVDAWMADSKEFHDLPARFVPAFCWAVINDGTARVIARALGNELVDAHALAAQRLGEAQVQIASLRREVGALTRRLGS